VASRNGSTLGRYQRLDLRAGKSFTRDRWKFTLYGELINAMNNKNFRVNSFDGVDAPPDAPSFPRSACFPSCRRSA